MKRLLGILALLAILTSMLATVGCDGDVYVGVSTWGPYGYGYGGPYSYPVTGGVVVGRPFY